MQNSAKKHVNYVSIWVFMIVLARLLPHLPNFSPLLGLCLFAGYKLPKRFAFVAIFLGLIISDLALAHLMDYPMLGNWTWFNYSAYAVLILFGTRLMSHFTVIKLYGYVIASSLGFWLWTNLGVWLLSGMYAKTMVGLQACYTAALPFLQNSLAGDLFWATLIFGVYNLILKPSLLMNTSAS